MKINIWKLLLAALVVPAAMGACTDSNWAGQYHLPGTFAPIADYHMLETCVETAKELGMVYANKNQVLLFDKSESEYVRQYEDIPKH